MNFEAVIFDLFGTLVDDFISSVGGTNTDLPDALGLPHEQFIPLWRQTSDMRTIGEFQTIEASLQYVNGLMGARVTREQIAAAVEIRLRDVRTALKPRTDAIATLKQLKKQGYKLGLVSNCSIEIPILWPQTEFAGLIESPVFSSRERLKKPDPRIYRLACECLGVLPERCLYIADGENEELAAAAKVGMRGVLLRNSSRDNTAELLREAREWQGRLIDALPEVLTLLGNTDDQL